MTETLIPFMTAAYGCLALQALLILRGFWIAVRWRKRYRRPALQSLLGLGVTAGLFWATLVLLMAHLSAERGTVTDLAAAERSLRLDIATGYRELENNWPEITKQSCDLAHQLKQHLKETGWLPEF